MSHRLSSLCRSVVGTVGALGLLVATIGMAAAPAGAAGDAGLDKLILTNPVPGWTPEPSAVVAPVASRLSSVEAGLVGSPVESAVQIWHGPEGGSALEILLVQFAADVPNPQAQVDEDVKSGCLGATQNNSLPSTSVAAIPNSSEAVCTSDGSTPSGLAIAWVNGRILASVIALGSIDQSQAVSIATSQAAVIPAGGVSDSSFPVGVLVLVVLGVAAIVVVVVLVLVRRKKPTPSFAGPGFSLSPGFPPGGYPPPYASPGFGAPAPGGTQSPGFGGYASSTAPGVAPPPGYPGGGAPTAGPAAPATFGGLPTLGGFNAPAPAPMAAPAPAPAPAPAAAPAGWQPVDGDPLRRRYWDGTAWTSAIRWDGSAWVVDPPGQQG